MIKERRAKLNLKKQLKTQNKMFWFLFDLQCMDGKGMNTFVCVALCKVGAFLYVSPGERVCKTSGGPLLMHPHHYRHPPVHTEGWQQQGREERGGRERKRNAQVPSESPLGHNGPASRDKSVR
jgi:hypothetical protein